MGSNPAARQWTHRLFAGIREFAITTIGLAIVHAVLWIRAISAKRRNKSNPWFKRGTLFRSAVDVLLRAEAPMTAREIAATLIADKAPQATRKQA